MIDNFFLELLKKNEITISYYIFFYLCKKNIV